VFFSVMDQTGGAREGHASASASSACAKRKLYLETSSCWVRLCTWKCSRVSNAGLVIILVITRAHETRNKTFLPVPALVNTSHQAKDGTL
jgi:hypothetical protein